MKRRTALLIRTDPHLRIGRSTAGALPTGENFDMARLNHLTLFVRDRSTAAIIQQLTAPQAETSA